MGLVAIVCLLVPPIGAQEPEKGIEGGGVGGGGAEIDPATLTRRADLGGKEIVLDERVSRIQNHPQTGFDQIFLKRAPDLPFELPPALRNRRSPQAVGVKIRGVLRHEGERWWVDVVSVDYLPSDLDRFTREIAVRARTDTEGRTAWIRCAEHRGQIYKDAKDDPLLK